jgi:hypothetical protein
MRFQLRWPSPAAVLAFIALLVALGGTALAATGTIVNIADPATPANKAKVNAAGALSTAATVPGGVAPAPPKTPFNFNGINFADANESGQMAPTTATIAMTGMRFANATPNGTDVSLYQVGVSASGCTTTSSTGQRFLGQFAIPAGQTVDEQLTTPLVLKPLSAGGPWCLVTYASGTTGSGFWSTYNGYVVSGTFASGTSTTSAAGPTGTPGNAPTRAEAATR